MMFLNALPSALVPLTVKVMVLLCFEITVRLGVQGEPVTGVLELSFPLWQTLEDSCRLNLDFSMFSFHVPSALSGQTAPIAATLPITAPINNFARILFICGLFGRCGLGATPSTPDRYTLTKAFERAAEAGAG